MYKFVKIAPKFEEGKGAWYFVPNSVDQVAEHFRKIFGSEIKKGVHDKTAGYGHPSSAWRQAVDQITQFNAYGLEYNQWILNATLLENEVLNKRIRDFESGMEMYLSDGVTQFCPRWDMYEKVGETESGELVYPHEARYRAEDAEYMQWDVPGVTKGRHWYAKIGSRDVRGEDGRTKWATMEEAQAAVRWFCDSLNAAFGK